MPCTLNPGNYFICSDGLSRILVPINTPDGIPVTHGLDPLRCLVVCVDQPLSDIRLKEATNVKLSITTVWGWSKKVHLVGAEWTDFGQKAWYISIITLVLLYSEKRSSIGTSGVGPFIESCHKRFEDASSSMRNNGTTTSTTKATTSILLHSPMSVIQSQDQKRGELTRE